MENEIVKLPDNQIPEQVNKAVLAATNLKVNSAEDVADATELLAKIKTVAKMVTGAKEAITKPANETLKAARRLFAPLEESYERAEKIVKDKILAYRQKEIEAARKKEEAVIKKLEAGTIDPEKAADKLGKIVPVTSVKAETGSIQYRKVKEVIIEDKNLVPENYWILDEATIKKVALAGGVIPGVKVIEKEIIASII